MSIPPKPYEFNGTSLHVTVTVAPENIDKFLAAFKACFDAVTAEPECTYFEVFQDSDTPGRFKWVENWSKDKEWFFKVRLPACVWFLLRRPFFERGRVVMFGAP